MLANFIIFLYLLAIILVLLYTISQFFLFISYIFNKRDSLVQEFEFGDLPKVTIQLPIFNEAYVVERLLACISKINYPADKLEIQVLDDSTDESLQFNFALVNKYASSGLDIVHIHRKNREHYKAGALKAGLELAKGDFIAMFDADFLPEPDWLIKSINYFTNPAIGVVQARWKHINRNQNLLTMVQGMALDHHFIVEQEGRNKAGYLINFNGTAGIWSKTCIIDAGNWEGDTLTEDLDLSYRAQLRKWQFVYLENLETPSELPVAISAVRTQQFRWNKGGAENFIKNIGKVFNSKNLGIIEKIHSLSHLLNSSVFLWAFLISVLSVPVLWFEQDAYFMQKFLIIGLFVKFNFIFLFFVFYVTFRKAQTESKSNFFMFVSQFFLFFPIILGLTFHNTVAVLEGYLGIKSAFIRTPKFNISEKSQDWKNNKYLKKKLSLVNFFEFLLFIYFALGIALAFYLQNFSFVFFHALLVLGYGYIVYKTIDE